jgi:hypothetical protein
MILSPKRSRWILGADACACACARLSFYRVGQVYDPHDTGFVDTEVLVLLLQLAACAQPPSLRCEFRDGRTLAFGCTTRPSTRRCGLARK